MVLEVALIDVTDAEGFEAAYRRGHPVWRAEISPFFAQPPLVQHFTDVKP